MAEIDPMKFFGLWMFTHEEADELMKASVERGSGLAGEGMSGGPDAFTDGFMAMVSTEKERLKHQLATGEGDVTEDAGDERFAEVRFEIGELRGRVDQMQRTLDAIAAHVGVREA
jgi:polyhydroxyalkanoate synthesis regulator phasin